MWDRFEEPSDYFSCDRRINANSWAPSAPFCAPGCPLLCARAHVNATDAENVCFFAFLGVCFRVRCPETWEHISILCNFFLGLLNLHYLSSLWLHYYLDVWLCRYAWFLHELQQSIISWYVSEIKKLQTQI